MPRFKIGQQVLVKDESVRTGRSKKLEAPYVGPYEIVKIEGPNLLLRTKRSKIMKIHANQAKPFFASLHMRTVFAWPLVCVVIIAGQDIDFRIEPVRSSSGLYYQSVGSARLYSTEWKVVTYLSLEGASNNVDAIRKYMDFTVAFCVKHGSLWQTDPLICNNLLDTIEKEYKKAQETKQLVL